MRVVSDARPGRVPSKDNLDLCHVDSFQWALLLPCMCRGQLLGRYFTYATSLLAAMSASTPLFDTIEADDPGYEQRTSATGNINTTANQASTNARPPPQMATNLNDAESGVFCHNSELGSVRGRYL